MPNLSSFFSNTQFVTMTAGEAISVGDIVSVSSSDGRVYWAIDPTDITKNVFNSFRPFYFQLPTKPNIKTLDYVPLINKLMSGGSNTTLRSGGDAPYSMVATPDKNIALTFITSGSSTGNTTSQTSSVSNAAILMILDPSGKLLSGPTRLFANGRFNTNTNISICANNNSIFVAASSIDTSTNTVYFAAYTNSGAAIYSNTVSNTNHCGWTYCQPTEDGGFLATTVGTIGLTSTGRMIVVNSSGSVTIANTISASANTTSNSAIANYKLLKLANTRNFALVQGPYNANSTTYYHPTIINITANTTFLQTTNTTLLLLPSANSNPWSAMDATSGSANDVYMTIGMSGTTNTVPTGNIVGAIYHINLSSNTYYFANTTGSSPNTGSTTVPPIGSSVRFIRTVSNTYAMAYSVTDTVANTTGSTLLEMFYDNGSALVSNGVYAIASLAGNTYYQMGTDVSAAAYANNTGTNIDMIYDNYNDILKIVMSVQVANNQASFSSRAINYSMHNGTSGIQLSSDIIQTSNFDLINIRGSRIPKFLPMSSIDTSNTTLYNSFSNVTQGMVGSTILILSNLPSPYEPITSGITGVYSFSNGFSLTPIGVATTDATAAGNTITIQILGTANTKISTKTPYSIDVTAAGGQKMAIIANTAIMNGTLVSAPNIVTNVLAQSNQLFRRSIS